MITSPKKMFAKKKTLLMSLSVKSHKSNPFYLDNVAIRFLTEEEFEGIVLCCR